MTIDVSTPGERMARAWGAKVDALTRTLASFKYLVLDADGVFFDGKETRGPSGIYKTRDLRDGQGVSFLRALGIRILFASGEGEPLDAIVEKLNRLPSVRSGKWGPIDFVPNMKSGKAAAIESWRASLGASYEELVYIGDDRTDCEAMAAVRAAGGTVVVPYDAQRVVMKYASWTLRERGGDGALREFAEMVLDARGVDEEGLATA